MSCAFTFVLRCGVMNEGDNRTPGHQVHDALVECALQKNEALKAEKLAKRVYSAVYLQTDGNVDERKAKALTNSKYEEFDDVHTDAESKYNLARAEADGMQCRFEEWRTRSATRRAEMGLI